MRTWLPDICRGTACRPHLLAPHRPSTCAFHPPRALHPAGVRKGTPWYFLTPSYWTGRGSGRVGSKNVVRTARWARWRVLVGLVEGACGLAGKA